MLKHKKILFPILIAPLFLLASCKKVTEPYKVINDPVIVSTHLKIEIGESFKREYKNGEVLDITDVTVTVDGNITNNRIVEVDKVTTENSFFVCGRNDFPTNSIIGSDFKASTNVESMDFSFYIATTIKVEEDSYQTFVSEPLTVTIKNPSAIKPWVWYTVTAVVVFGVIGMVMLTRYYKNKKEGKN